MYLFVNSFSPLKLYVLNILTTIRQLCLKPCMAVRNMLHCINSTRNGTHDALNILSFFLRPEERKTICHCVKCFLRAQREHFRAIPLIIGRYTWNAELLSAWHGAIYIYVEKLAHTCFKNPIVTTKRLKISKPSF